MNHNTRHMSFRYIWNRVIKKIRGVAIRNSEIHQTSKVESGSQIVNSKMDRYSFCGYDCKIINCRIGSFCSIADGVAIGGVRHPIEWVSTSPVFYFGRDSVKKKYSEYRRDPDKCTVIGNDVWIGERALIKAGVTIGTGAVIGMGSVVTKDVGAYEIWAGNPARMIKKRFGDKTIERLMNSKWWEMDDDKLKKAACHIRDPKVFLSAIEDI